MPLPRPGWRIPHRRTRTSRSPLLLREVRRSFSEERDFHFKLTVTALQFPDPLVIRHSFRERLSRSLLPVRLHPEAQRSIVHSEFPRYLGNRQRVIDHLSGGLLLKLVSISFRFPRHLIPFLSG